MVIADKDLYNLLAQNEILSAEELKKVQNQAVSEKIPFYDALLKSDLISDENLGKLIADNLKLPFVVLSKVAIPEEILRILPEIVARKHRIIIFDKDKNGIKLASDNPHQKETFDFIARKVGERVKLYFATPKDITDALNLYKKELQKSFDALLKEQVAQADKTGLKEAPIAKIVDLLIEYAYDNKASDIHIEPTETDSSIRFRIDGMLHDVLILPKNLHEQLITRIKVLSKLRTDEHLAAQDGKIRVKLAEEELDIRVSIVPIINGEKSVMRLLSLRSRQFSLTELGISEQDLDKVKKAYLKPFGMVLSTGPTGSGKTTTIYAILKILNTREKNIATIEDPVEYEIEGVNQIQVNPKTNLTFAEGLRSILRQDPDIILVGEIRDKETADIAINSAMTGHLVLSTLHTNNAATALPRLLDMDIEPFLVASTVNVVIAQRLVREICEKCKVSYTIKLVELIRYIPENLIKKYLGEASELRLYHGKGCPVCHSTGYIGRVGLFEILEITPVIQQLITQKEDAEVINKKAIEEGMITMLEDGLSKVQQGVTTLEEVLRVTKT